HADPSTARAPSVARDADHDPPDLSADHDRRPEQAGARGMTVRRRGLMVLLGLLAIATIVTAVVLAGGPPENEGPGTSAFDPSVPTSTHTPPPASGTAAPADPAAAPAGDPTDPVTVPASPSAPSPSASGLEEVEAETSPILLAVLEETAEISPEEPSDVVGELSDVATRAFLSELEAE